MISGRVRSKSRPSQQSSKRNFAHKKAPPYNDEEFQVEDDIEQYPQHLQDPNFGLEDPPLGTEADHSFDQDYNAGENLWEPRKRTNSRSRHGSRSISTDSGYGRSPSRAPSRAQMQEIDLHYPDTQNRPSRSSSTNHRDLEERGRDQKAHRVDQSHHRGTDIGYNDTVRGANHEYGNKTLDPAKLAMRSDRRRGRSMDSITSHRLQPRQHRSMSRTGSDFRRNMGIIPDRSQDRRDRGVQMTEFDMIRPDEFADSPPLPRDGQDENGQPYHGDCDEAGLPGQYGLSGMSSPGLDVNNMSRQDQHELKKQLKDRRRMEKKMEREARRNPSGQSSRMGGMSGMGGIGGGIDGGMVGMGGMGGGFGGMEDMRTKSRNPFANRRRADATTSYNSGHGGHGRSGHGGLGGLGRHGDEGGHGSRTSLRTSLFGSSTRKPQPQQLHNHHQQQQLHGAPGMPGAPGMHDEDTLLAESFEQMRVGPNGALGNADAYGQGDRRFSPGRGGAGGDSSLYGRGVLGHRNQTSLLKQTSSGFRSRRK